ncbi:UNVERIFIED_CONTAM: hypothetical protein PYX00_003225 [Menopon gallinae]|uniref:Cytochrome-b5 reductase n=1 Tax=Menopon gallinae TaxID=328185 RepID=A0AAW2I0S3_9NEOP
MGILMSPGNPRNKVALQPGHSLMDWIRLGNSGRDLTSVGGVNQDVTEEELAKHAKEDNAWIAIRGKVYNIAPYLKFHPGGISELMKGAGRDATTLFTEVHPWVNFESILGKCYIGRLVRKNPATPLDLEKAFFENLVPDKEKDNRTQAKCIDEGCKDEPVYDTNIKMCWVQTENKIRFVFLCNTSSPHVVIKMLPGYHVRILIRIRRKLHVFGFQLEKKVYWPCYVTVNTDSGRLEVEFTKKSEEFWDKYGVDDKDNATIAANVDEIETYHTARIISMEDATHNVRIFIFKFVDKVYMWVPIGHDIRIRTVIEGIDCAKQYTPIPPYLPHGEPVKHWHNDYICCMVKLYPEGALTPYLFSKKMYDTVELGGISGTFNIRRLNGIKHLYLIAAGSGLAPMLRLLVWAVTKKHELKSLDLLSVNRYENDIIWRDKLDEFAKREKWFKVTYMLSQPDEGWNGLTGRVDEQMLNNFLPDFDPASGRDADFYICACGPIQFVEMIQEYLTQRDYYPYSHCFLG